MSTAISQAIYEALAEAVEVPTYLEGDVPDNAGFPYLVYGLGAVNTSRMSIASRMQVRDLTVQVLATGLEEADALADAVEEAIVGISVAAANEIDPFPGGFERAEGVWRVYDTDPSEIDGDRYYRIVLSFEQRETV